MRTVGQRAGFVLAALALLAAASGGSREKASPVLFLPGLKAGEGHYGWASLTPDSQTVYFARYFDFTVEARKSILVSHRAGDRWSKPEPMPFSGNWSDTAPFVSPDGRRLYFASNRPAAGRAGSDFDIWWAELRDGVAGVPRRANAVNSPENETSPSVTARGVLYFCSWRDEGGQGLGDLWRAEPSSDGFAAPVNLGPPINGPTGEWGVAVSADEGLLVFESSGRPDALSESGDLYISRREAGRWTTPRHLPAPINSPASELAPRFSPDGRSLYFASNRRGHLQMWHVDLDWGL